MDLVIVRHADAEPDSGRGDAARRLTPVGERQARGLVAELVAAGLRPMAVYSSPYARTMATARPIAEAFGLSATATPELASGRLDPFAVTKILNESGAGCAVVVGHMPDVAAFEGWLTGAEAEGFGKAEWRVVTFAGEVGKGLGEPGT